MESIARAVAIRFPDEPGRGADHTAHHESSDVQLLPHRQVFAHHDCYFCVEHPRVPVILPRWPLTAAAVSRETVAVPPPNRIERSCRPWQDRISRAPVQPGVE